VDGGLLGEHFTLQLLVQSYWDNLGNEKVQLQKALDYLI